MTCRKQFSFVCGRFCLCFWQCTGIKYGEPPQLERLAVHLVLRILRETNHNFGPAATKALPAALLVNFSKFLMKREERSLALSSHDFFSV